VVYQRWVMAAVDDGELPERAQHVPGQQDRFQAFAADVADDRPYPVPGGDDHIQIAAGSAHTKAEELLPAGDLMPVVADAHEASIPSGLNAAGPT
jgi:hypothetical protein